MEHRINPWAPLLVGLVGLCWLGLSVKSQGIQVKPTVQPREYPSYCYDRSRDFYLPCMYSSKEYKA